MIGCPMLTVILVAFSPKGGSMTPFPLASYVFVPVIGSMPSVSPRKKSLSSLPMVSVELSIVGGRSIALVYPAERVAVAILCNETFAPFGREDALTVADLFLGP